MPRLRITDFPCSKQSKLGLGNSPLSLPTESAPHLMGSVSELGRLFWPTPSPHPGWGDPPLPCTWDTSLPVSITCTCVLPNCVSLPPKSSVVPPATESPLQHMSLGDACQHETNTHTCPIHPHIEQLLTTSRTHHSPLSAEKAFKALPYIYSSRFQPPAWLFSQPNKEQMCSSSPHCNPAGPYEACLEQAFPHILCCSSVWRTQTTVLDANFLSCFAFVKIPTKKKMLST